MKKSLRLPLFLAVSAVVLLAAAAFPQNDICVPGIGGLAGTPVIDGIVDGYTGPGGVNSDPGWNGATRWNLSGDHGATTGTKFQAGFAGGSLYLSYVIDTPAYGQDNTIVIGFAQTGAAASTDWRIHIIPFNVAPPPDGANIAPLSVVYWRDSTTWNSGAGGINANGLWPSTNTKVSKAGNRWAVEIQVPVTNNIANAAANNAVYLPAAGTFSFYTAVFSTFGFIDNMVVQDPFPAGVEVTPGDLLEKSIPPVPNWGVASLNSRPACTGVSISWPDIGVEFPAMSLTIVQQIRRYNGAISEATLADCNALGDGANPGLNGPNNVFIARPLNEMGVTATNVFATFRLANWGIPAPQLFDRIGSPSFLGVSNNPTPPANILPAANASLRANWALTYKQSCQYMFQTHECIQVDVDSNDPLVRFKNKSVQKNMDFVPASTFKRTAIVSGAFKPITRDEMNHFVLVVDTDQQLTRGAVPPRDWERKYRNFRSDELNRVTRKTTGVAQFAWIARGIRLRDDFIIINKTKYRLGVRAGDFGYVASHSGPFSNWQWTLLGEQLAHDEKNPNVFRLDVKPGHDVELLTVLEAVGGRAPKETTKPTAATTKRKKP
jgi:hypothetical protein